MFKRILCALDGSSHANKALELAVHLARSSQTELLIAHCLLRGNAPAELQHFAEIEGLTAHVEPELRRLEGITARLEVGEAFEDRAVSPRVLVEIGQRLLDGALQDVRRAGVHDIDTILMDGDPADQILRCIEERDVDCVILGSRGLGELKGLFMGSVSHKVAHRCPCTCIAVK